MAKSLAAPMQRGSVKNDEKSSGFWLNFMFLTLLSAASGAFVAVQTAEITRASLSGKKSDTSRLSVVTPNYAEAPRLWPMRPLVTNLAAPTDAWVRVQASLIFSQDVDSDTPVMVSRIEEDILAYLRSLTMAHLEGAIGLQHLREDLNERARLRSNSQVREVILEALVIQ